MTVSQSQDRPPDTPDVLVILLPLLVVLSTLLFLLLLFLISILCLRRRRGIALRDNDGPIDMSREDLIDGEGGFDGVESRWLESVSEPIRREYLRAKDFQLQYPPNSLPSDITLSQFLSIQEKGVSAWCFEPDVETINSLLVHARTEITFLPDPASASCVQSNLPLPKLNEVYYWEVKMFDLPPSTNVAVGLATKPYPLFRLPGLSKFSLAYHSNGDKSYNYPFTTTGCGPQLKEGDVLGVGYRPRSGTVFFTRNGRKLDDAFTGLSRWNLFPTIGADGPCSVHVNLGQSGFVFIEANVKKWGLAPSVGTLAPPPAYGSERGSILLDVGGGTRSLNRSPSGTPGASSPSGPVRRNSHRSRRPKPNNLPIASSPLRPSSPFSPGTPPPPITPISEEASPVLGHLPEPQPTYISPTDAPIIPGRSQLPPSLDDEPSGAHVSFSPRSPSISAWASSPSRSNSPEDDSGAIASSSVPWRRPHSHSHDLVPLPSLAIAPGPEATAQVHPPPESPYDPNPPTPNQRDIHLQALPPSAHRRTDSSATITMQDRDGDSDTPTDRLSDAASLSRRGPPAYSPLDAYTYAEGVHIDLPAEVIAAALEGQPTPSNAVGQSNSGSDRRRSHRR